MTGNRIKAGLVALSLALAPWLAADAVARGRGISGEEAMAVMKAMELSPELQVDGVGDPRIQFQVRGLAAFLNFYDCQAGRCGSLQLETALDLEHGTTLQTANVFNSRYRYVRLHLDDEMDPSLQYDFEMLHADHAAHLRSQVEIFSQLLAGFTEAMDF